MALEVFRPTIWSRQVTVDLDKAFVFKNIANTDFEGEARFGNAVKIQEVGDLSVETYGSTGLSAYGDVPSSSRTLNIDQQKVCKFKVEDIAKVQSNVELMQKFSAKQALAIADNVDQYIAALYSQAGVTASALGDSSTGIDVYAAGKSTDGLIYITTRMHQALDESNAPSAGRYAVIPPWLHAYLNFTGIINSAVPGLKDGMDTYGNGFIGNALGFDWYVSNNVSNDSTDYRVMFGTRDAIAFVGQIEEMESIRLESYMADGVRLLYVYGAKVVRPDRLGVAYLAAGGLST